MEALRRQLVERRRQHRIDRQIGKALSRDENEVAALEHPGFFVLCRRGLNGEIVMELADGRVGFALHQTRKVDVQHIGAGVNGRLGGKLGFGGRLRRRLRGHRLLRHERAAAEAEDQAMDIQPEGRQQPQPGHRRGQVVGIMIQIIGRQRLSAEGRQEQHRAEVHRSCEHKDDHQPVPALRAAAAEKAAENRQAQGRDGQQHQRQPVFAHRMYRHIPEFQHLSAVPHGIS